MRSGRQIDNHARRRCRIIRRVAARAAVQHVRAAQAGQHVVARAALQHVGAAVAGQHVIARAAGQVLDIGERVALGDAAAAQTSRQVDGDGGGRRRIARRIDTHTAVEHVRPRAAVEHVVARAAGQHVGVAVAGQRVVVRRTRDVLDIAQRISRRIAAAVHAGRQIDRHARRRGRVIDRIGARAAVDRVGARARDDRVVARARLDRPARRPCREPVGIGRADDVGEVAEDIAAGVAARHLCRRQVEVDRHARAGIGVGDGVVAGATIERVGTAKAFDDVVPGATSDVVDPGGAGQCVGIIGTEDRFDTDIGVALSETARADTGIQVNGDAGGAVGIVGEIAAARAAIQHVGPEVRHQRVVARAAGQPPTGQRSDEHVVIGRADQVLDVDERVALRIAARTGPAGDRPADIDGEVGCQIDDDARCRRRIVRRIVAGAAVQRIGAAETGQHVVARAALQHVGVGVTRQRIVEGGTGQVLEIGQRVALRVSGGAGTGRQADDDGSGRSGIAGGIVARAAVQHVRARAAFDRVVTRAARQHVGIAVAGQRVVIARAGDALDRGQHVALRIAAAVGAGGEVDRHAGVRLRIVGGVRARAAVQRIGTGSRDQLVVARAAGQPAAGRRGAQRVGIGRARDVLDAGERVALCIAPDAGAGRQIDRDGGTRRRIVRGVAARPAVQHVRAAQSRQHVVARPTGQRVRAGIAGQQVGIGRPDQVFDIGERVALRVAPRAGAGRQVDGNARRRPGIARGVVAGAAVKRVRPGPAGQQVIARAADQRVGVGIAGQGVVAGRSDDALDAGQRVAIGVAAHALAGRQIDRYRRHRRRVIGGVETGAAVHHVGAAAADQRIVVVAAAQRVVAGTAGQPVRPAAAFERRSGRGRRQRVAIGRSDDPFDTGQHVAAGVATAGGAGLQVDRHRRARRRIVRRVEAVAARQHVGARAALQRVVTGTAQQLVVARAAFQHVVAVTTGQHVVGGVADDMIGLCGADGVLYVAQDVAIGKAALADAAAEVDIDPRSRAGIVDRVDAVAAQQRVGAQAADQRVVARTARQRFRTGAADQPVVERGADHLLDRDQRIAGRVAARPGAGGQIDRHRRHRGRIVGGIETGPAVQRVGATEAGQYIVASAAGQHVRAAGAGQDVGQRGPEEILEIGDLVARGVAARCRAGRQVNVHSAGRGRIVERVGTRAAVQNVAARPAANKVVARPAGQRVRARAADQRVVERAADDRFDIGQHVAGGVAAAGGTGREIHRDGGVRVGIIDGIITRSAVEGLRARARHQRVVAALTGQGVRVRIALKPVRLVAADRRLDAREAVALGIAARSGAAREVQRHALRRRAIVDRVEPGPAGQHVGAGTPRQHVVARAAVEPVGPGVAGQHIGTGGAGHVLDAAQHVAGGVATRAQPGREVDRDAGGRRRIIDPILAAAAADGIGAGAGIDHVVAKASGDHRSRHRRAEDVVMGRAGHILDRHQRVAGGVAARGGAGREIDRHAGRRGGIIDGVAARAAVQHVGARAARQYVVTSATGQHVGPGVAGQHVVVGRARDVFEIADDIALGIAAGRRPRRQIDRHALRGRRIVQRVDTRAAIQDVGTRAPANGVVAGTAGQRVGAGIADQHVVKRAAGDGLDPGQRIALRIAAAAGLGREVDAHAGAGCGIIRGIEAVAADQRISTRAADQHVIARSAPQRIVARAADQHIVAGAAGQHVGAVIAAQHVVVTRAGQVLDRNQRIALRVAARRGAGGQIDPHGVVRIRIIGGVDADPAVQHVGAAATGKDIVARPAAQRLAGGRAGDAVVIGGADHHLDAGQRVALRIAADIYPGRQVDGDRRVRRAIVSGIGPVAAQQRIRARTTDQRIVARPARQRVGGGVAGQHVVETAARYRFDTTQPIALGIAAMPGAGGEVDLHPGLRTRIIRRIEACAALQQIGARAARQHIVARTADQRIAARAAGDRVVARAAVDHRAAVAAGQRVVLGRTRQVLDRRQGVAGRVAAVGESRLEVDDNPIGRIDEARGIDAVAAQQRVGARARDQHVVARAAGQDAARCRRAQLIVIGRADDVLDVAQPVAFGIAILREARRQIDRNRSGRCGIIGGVVARSAIERIRPRATDQHVVTGTAGQHVGVAVAGQRVIEGRSGDVLDTRKRVALGVAAMPQARHQADLDRLRRGGIVGGVEAAATDQGVRAGSARQRVVAFAAFQRIAAQAAEQRVVAAAAVERIVAVIADQGIRASAALDRVRARRPRDAVVIGRADDMLDRQQPVALGVAALADAAVHRDGDAGPGVGIADRVVSRAAVERVGAAKPDEQIIARAAFQGFVRAAALQRIVEIGADDLFDRGQRVPARKTAGPRTGGKIYRNRGGGGAVVGGVEPGAAVHDVGTERPDQRVVAALSVQDVRRVRTAQPVVIGRSRQPLDTVIGIALGIAAMIGAAVQPDVDGRAGIGIIGDIGSSATDQLVRAAAPGEHVVAGAAGQDIRPAVAAQMIVERRTGQRFDTRKRVALGIAAMTDRPVERDRHGRRRFGVARGVVTRTADQPVGPGAADQGIVPRAAGKRIVARAAAQQVGVVVAGQRVVANRSDHILDAGQRIALGVAAMPLAGRKVDLHRRRRCRIVRRVLARTAVERIRARTADQRVVPGATRQHVVFRIADQQVVEITAQHALDIDELVARRAAGRHATVEIDVHPARSVRIVRRVEPVAAIQYVGAQTADQDVVAGAAAQYVVTRAAGQRIVMGRAVDFLDAGQRIALGVAAMADRTVEPDRDPGLRAGIIGDIVALTTVEHIRARTARQDVVAGTARKLIVAVVADQRVVERGTDEILDIGQRVALGVAAAAGRPVEVHRHRRARTAIVGGVDTVAAIQRVRPAAAGQDVVARPARQPVVAIVADQRVVECRSFQPFDRDELVAGGVAGHRRSVECRAYAGRRALVTGDVDPVAAVQHVRPARAFQHVVARPAGQRVGVGITDQMIGERRPGEVLHVGVGVALGIAAVADAPVEKHFHTDRAVGKAGAVDPRAAVDMIRARPADQDVVARVPVETVIMGRTGQVLDAGQHVALRATAARRAVQMGNHAGRRRAVAGGVDAIPTDQRVAAAATDEEVVALAALQRLGRRRAIDPVVAIRADDVLDIDDGVAFGIAAVAGGAVEVDLDAPLGIGGCLGLVRERARIGNRVEAGPAVDAIRARAADQDVVAVIAGQRVVAGRAGDVLDIGVGIAFGIAALAGARLQVDGHARIGHRVADGIGSATAIDLVGARPRHDRVVAVAGIDDVARRIGEQDVDRRAGYRIGGRHVGVRRHGLDAEMGRDLDGIGIVGAIGRQAEIDRQEELALEAVGRGVLAGGGQRVGQLDVEAEVRFGRRVGDRGAGRVLAGRLDLDIALIDADYPALAGLFGVGDRITVGQRGDEHAQQAEIGRRHHRIDMQHAKRRAGRCRHGIVHRDEVVASGAGDRLLGRLRGIGLVGRRPRSAGGPGDLIDAARRAVLHPFVIVEFEAQRRDQLGQSGTDPGAGAVLAVR